MQQRVRETFGKRGSGKALGNLYVEALRWACDRINKDNGGIIAFVHPNSLCDANSLAGVRASLRDEFTDIYVVNLRGNAYKSGEERRKEGSVIFEALGGRGGSRNGVQITLLVHNPAKDTTQPAVLHYAVVPEYSSLKTKFDWLKEIGDVTNKEHFKQVPVNDNHDWVNLTDDTFQDLLPICTTKQTPQAAVKQHALGIATNCDAYVYSFSQTDLIHKMRTLINTYEEARRCVHETRTMTFDEATRNIQLNNIKWTGRLKQSLKKGVHLTFDENRIREVLYRPFLKLWLYEDPHILSSVKTVSALF